jgi:hypothetical protein
MTSPRIHLKKIKLQRFGLVFIILLATALISPYSFGQRKTKLNTNGQGTLFGGINYNRSYYSNSQLSFTGPEFNFRLNGTKLSDTPSGNSSYFHSEGLEFLQFNAQIGYFIKPRWAISFNFERLNFFTPSDFSGEIDGVIAPGSSTLSGEYNNETIDLTSNDLYLEHSMGVNLVGVSLHRMDQIFKSKKAIFELLSYTRLGAGAIFSNANFTFNGIRDQQITSLSGVAFTASAGVRTVFLQHFYLQFNLTGGIINQRSVALGQNRSVQHLTPYLSPEIGLGFSYFVRPTNNCNTCPQW